MKDEHRPENANLSMAQTVEQLNLSYLDMRSRYGNGISFDIEVHYWFFPDGSFGRWERFFLKSLKDSYIPWVSKFVAYTLESATRKPVEHHWEEWEGKDA